MQQKEWCEERGINPGTFRWWIGRQQAVQAEVPLESAEKRFQIAGKQAEDAREDYRLALRRYDAQVGTNLDMLDSRTALTNSRRAVVNAVYDIAAAQCGMMFAVGEDVPGRIFCITEYSKISL